MVTTDIIQINWYVFFLDKLDTFISQEISVPGWVSKIFVPFFMKV